ncbi:SPFH domain-containing protein [Streptomyces sp. NPDC056210]|uniref:SPFH domain-containing protein n=1 Tax=Streptomyces TaxID=1883 RepID=UPI001D0B0A7A|nr:MULTISPECIES: SPFH domain-containing protein [Streptomyces]MCX5081932.1 SPFH domain-containing protein [Streptomyces sp. NBC_00401]UDM00142.1 SPFH domain-containing protein [Streptomyces longhuiensis]
MSTTTEWPEGPELPAEADGGGARDDARGGQGVSGGVRAAGFAEPGTGTSGGWGARLIRGGAATEIPVHLLSRDGPDPVSVPLRPAVVGGRRSGGELPRVLRRLPSRPPSRQAPVVDPDLVERPGRTLPGAVGVLGGLAGAAGGAASLWWGGVLPHIAALPVPAGAQLGPVQWAAVAGAGTLALFGFGGLARGRTGKAWVLTCFGRYRGTVRRTGLTWVNPLFLRRRTDVRLRHWRSEAMPAVDANGVALRVVILVVWRVKDTACAAFAVEDHQEYLRQCVEAAMARVLSQLPADAFHQDAPTLRDAEAVGDALTRQLATDAAPVGIEVFSAQPTRIEYAPEIAAAMQRRRIAALDAQHRDSVLTSVVDSVEDTMTRLTTRGLVELDDYERKALVKDLTVAFYTGRGGDAS